MKRQATRRGFFFGLAAGSAMFPSTLRAETRGAMVPVETSLDGEAYWQLVRAQFSFHDEKVPMNAANLCPSTRAVSERVEEFTQDIDRDCSFNNRAKFRELLEESRKKVARQLGVSPDEIALVRNTSEANNVVNNGLNLEQGDEILLWDQNHPTNNVAWDVRAARFGFLVKRIATSEHPRSSTELFDAFAGAFTNRTKVLAITHLSNVSGIRLPVAELVEAAHQRGIHVHVDGAQSWGAFDVNLRDLGCDSYSGSAHKWFMGPKEAGVLYVREDRIPHIWANIVAPGWGNDVESDMKGARKFESLGQRDDACLAAVGTAVDFHDVIGSERIEARVLELASTLKSGLHGLGLNLVTPMEPELSGPVVIVSISSTKRRELLDRLYEEHGIAGAATGGLRLCPHVYNTMEHVKRAVAGVEALQRSILA